MKDGNAVPAGSEPINPLIVDNQEPATQEPEVKDAPATDKQEPKTDDSLSRLEKMFQDSQSMIGKQSSEIGMLRSKLEEMSKPAVAPGPDDTQVLNDILTKMDSGDITIEQGMKEALAINSKLTASQVMQQLSAQRETRRFRRFREIF